MRKIISLALAAVLVICCFGLVSCGGSDAEGKYEIYTYAGIEWDAEEMGGTMAIELKSGGEAIYSQTGEEDEIGTWEVDGSTVTITISGAAVEFELSGDKLISGSGETQVVYKK